MGSHALSLLRSAWSGLEVSPIQWVRTTDANYPGEVFGRTESGVRFSHTGAEVIIVPGYSGNQYNRFEFGEGGSDASVGIWSGDAPEVGSLVCGDPVGPTGSKRYRSWFKCDDKLEALLQIVRDGTTMSENELGVYFAGQSDHFWALLRLVLFDNVEIFVQCAGQSYNGSFKRDKRHTEADDLTHPAYGKILYQSDSYTSTLDWDGMRLPTSVSEYVHELSWRLETPDWWETYKSLMGEFLEHRGHPMSHGICRACLAENPNVHTDGWPYLPKSWQEG